MRSLILVGCCAEKLARIARARDMYRSTLFRKAAQYADKRGDWQVISAAYGLIKPDSQMAPYDCAMSSLDAEARAQWARSVARQLEALAHFWEVERLEVSLLAGKDYATWVPLVAPWCTVHQPLQGLQVGERLHWFNQQLQQPALFPEVA
jgi:hypothetical protein